MYQRNVLAEQAMCYTIYQPKEGACGDLFEYSADAERHNYPTPVYNPNTLPYYLTPVYYPAALP
jgi:hypothetical protein